MGAFYFRERVNGCCHGACGYCYAIGVQHPGAKSGYKLVTLFDSYSYDGVSAGMWVIHTGAKSGGEVVTLFDSYSYDGVSAGIWVIHTGAKSGGELFLCTYD